MTTPYIIVLVTTSNKREAENILNRLLEDRLVACGNILSKVSSQFWWQERIEKAEESIILMKSRKDLFARISELVRALHGYEVPEIIAVEVSEGSRDYLDWLESCLLSKKKEG